MWMVKCLPGVITKYHKQLQAWNCPAINWLWQLNILNSLFKCFSIGGCTSAIAASIFLWLGQMYSYSSLIALSVIWHSCILWESSMLCTNFKLEVQGAHVESRCENCTVTPSVLSHTNCETIQLPYSYREFNMSPICL